MVKRIFAVSAVILCYISVNAQSLCDEKFKDADGIEISLDRNDNAIFLITSADCGYCLINAPYFDSIAETFNGKYRCVALYDSNLKEIKARNDEYPKFKLHGWTIVPNSRNKFIKYLSQETYPQLHIYHDGKPVKTTIGTLDSLKKDMWNFLSNPK